MPSPAQILAHGARAVYTPDAVWLHAQPWQADALRLILEDWRKSVQAMHVGAYAVVAADELLEALNRK